MPQASLSSPPFVTSPEPSNLHCFRVKALTSSRIDASMVINSLDETVADGGSLHLQDFVIFNFSVPVFFMAAALNLVAQSNLQLYGPTLYLGQVGPLLTYVSVCTVLYNVLYSCSMTTLGTLSMLAAWTGAMPEPAPATSE